MQSKKNSKAVHKSSKKSDKKAKDLTLTKKVIIPFTGKIITITTMKGFYSTITISSCCEN